MTHLLTKKSHTTDTMRTKRWKGKAHRRETKTKKRFYSTRTTAKNNYFFAITAGNKRLKTDMTPKSIRNEVVCNTLRMCGAVSAGP
jgi:hypothetical protein